ncbi:hypothetical protein F511_26158 [Dorcoceras hygrometricum]|uniref:Uncharacterized protein n=1 Tax=Dorcoceras hygrometricum TaxID=472368 RepID=A0A2Z7A3M2_9LAMI|nr:hypothetical protein F511_26158 [Dorcoceras hygrometricum]
MLMTAITFDVKVNWSNLMFSVFKDMVAPATRQAKGYAIQVCGLLKNILGLDLGESRAFPIPRVLTAKNVHRYVHINEKVGMEDTAASPRMKKTHVKKAVSQKRSAVGVEAAPVVKKKRTTKGKPVIIAQEAVPLKIVEATADAPVEQPPVSKIKSQKRKRRLVLSAVDETVDTPTDQPDAAVETTVDEHPAAEVESTVVKQPAVMVAPATGVQEPVDENVERVVEPVPESVEQPAVAPVVEVATDDPDAIIEQVLDQLDSVAANQDSGDQPTATIDETIPWYDLPFEFATRDSERLFETGSDTEDDMDLDEVNEELPVGSGTDAVVGTVADIDTVAFGTDVGNQQEQSFDAYTSRTDAEDYLVEESDEELVPETEKPSADEAMSLEDILMTIPVGVPLPSAGVEIEESDEELVPETEKPSADEAMSLEDILMTIPVGVPLPSAGVEITRITLGKEIHIPGVTERTWYLAGLPQIPVDDKGKEPLLQKDPVKGNPVQEQILLIVVDVGMSCPVTGKGYW